MIQKTLTKMFDAYKTDFPKTLLHTGVVTYALSSAAQVGAIKLNKNLDENQKDYLTKQEIAEGSVNAALFYTVCQYVKNKAEKLTKTGVILPDSARKLLEELDAPEKIADVQQFFLSKFQKNFDPNILPKIADALDDIKLIKPFVNNVAGFVAGFLACNIITPYARNLIANSLHKKKEPPSPLK